MTLFIVPTGTFNIGFGFKSDKTCKIRDAHKTVPMGPNMVLLIVMTSKDWANHRQSKFKNLV